MTGIQTIKRFCTGRVLSCLVISFIIIGSAELTAQTTSTDWAWKVLLRHEGLEFAYIFYNKADNYNNGIVLKLTNRNEYEVSYRFKMVLRSDDREVEIPVFGELAAKSMKTGEQDGLFFVPFKDGTEISELGLREYHVVQSSN